MADTLTAEKRAQDIVDKYHVRMDKWSTSDGPDAVDEHNAIISELKADIANAINAVVNEYSVKAAAADKAVKDAKAAKEPEPPRARPAVTHMPATGMHGKSK